MDDAYDPSKDPSVLKPESEYFDFATTTRVAFDINYGAIGGNALIEIFTEDPVSYNESGTFMLQGKPAYKIFADAKGRFSGNVELPTAVGSVYIYSPTWGVPRCVKAKVENGKVVLDETQATVRTTTATRMTANPKLSTVDKSKKLYSLVEIGNPYGKPKDTNELTTEGDLTSIFIDNIQKTLWQGANEKPKGLNNKRYVRETRHVNTTIAEVYKNENNQTITVEDAELYFTFLTEAGWNQNTVGYYYYKAGECPASPEEVTKIIIFPNASITGGEPYSKDKPGNLSYGYYDYAKENAPLRTNQKIQLLFQDENGQLTPKFPAGYTIGYFIIVKGFSCGNEGSIGTINAGNTFVYSNAEWNQNYEGQRSRFLSLSTAKGTVVYGVEDGEDTSYEDILFCIDASPNEAIQDPDRPSTEPDKPKMSETEDHYSSFAFEDIWPTGGDYDLNDAIIEYHRVITFDKDNYVSQVKEIFKPVQKAGAASYKNAFAVQYESGQRGTIALPSGAVDETTTSSVILFPDAMQVREQEFVITRTFADKTMLKGNLKTETSDLNPYIIVHYEEAGKGNRTEVHLPKAKATMLADPGQIGKKEDAYYTNKDGKHPFALLIPASFTPVTEGVKIEKEYPEFEKWVESNGTACPDWYMHYQKQQP